MNKIIRKFSFVLFMLIILSITIPNAVKATKFCIEPDVMRFSEPSGLRAGTESIVRYAPVEYGTATEADKLLYMRDYVLISDGDWTDEEKQQTIHKILGASGWYSEDAVKTDRVNKLYNEAVAYANNLLAQEISDTDKIELKKDENAKTSFFGSALVYGPIYVTYPMGELELGRVWSGFYYEFKDENGNNLTDKIKLCTYENGEYNEIKYQTTEERII